MTGQPELESQPATCAERTYGVSFIDEQYSVCRATQASLSICDSGALSPSTLKTDSVTRMASGLRPRVQMLVVPARRRCAA